MKLEAVHPLDPTSICVASVARVFDANHFLVKIDDLIATQEEIANCFIAHKGSARIFEIGFCHKNGLPLQQPRGMFQLIQQANSELLRRFSDVFRENGSELNSPNPFQCNVTLM